MPDDLPSPIGPEVDFLVRKALLLKQHHDTVREATERAERVIADVIRHEVGHLLICGYSEAEAGKIAAQETAYRQYEILQELEALLGYHDERLRTCLQRLQEELGDP